MTVSCEQVLGEHTVDELLSQLQIAPDVVVFPALAVGSMTNVFTHT
jgi:hypothetical protein